MTRHYSLRKTERLKSRKQIELLFSEGKKFAVNPYRVHYLLNTSSGNKGKLLFAVGVSSKSFRKSVDRNRIKRLTREAFRLQKSILSERIEKGKLNLNIFLIYTGKELSDYELVSEKMEDILKKLLKITGS